MSKAVIGFMFDDLGLHRVYCTAYAENESIHALNRKLGFVREGVHKEHVRGIDGKWHDIHMFACSPMSGMPKEANSGMASRVPPRPPTI